MGPPPRSGDVDARSEVDAGSATFLSNESRRFPVPQFAGGRAKTRLPNPSIRTGRHRYS